MKTHKVFTISSMPFNIDLVSGQLWNLDIEGLTENDSNLIIYTNDKSNVSVKSIENELQKLVKENILESYSIEEGEIKEINWNEEWEKKLKPIQVSEKIIISPSFHKVENSEDKIVITIDPKMSFGTGEHETTKLVLQFLEEIYTNQQNVLDVGSGTAVLAIAVAKMGAQNVIALDNDEWCFENGNENTAANKVADKVDVRLGELIDISENNFDLVLANINKNILIDISDTIFDKTAPGGDLILSGLLKTDEEDIKEVYIKKGYRFIQLKQMNEWIALYFKK